ncbi:MAG: phage holin family protein [Porphyromonadaceae bacterium]|nr:phage holin family protein [Porphyromonadaceae bacterium]
MEEKKVSTLFEEMRNDISRFITSTLELGKLEAYEKISLSASAIVYGLILAGALLFALLFILVTAGLYLGELLQSLWLGFGVVALFTLLALLIILLVGKSFKKKFASRVVRFLMRNDDNDEKNSKK